MFGQHRRSALWAFLLLTATLCPCGLARRGRGFGGRMGGMGAQGPARGKSSSNTGLKLAGAAAAGAVGGAMIGHGLSSMGRPGYGYGGYGGYGYGGYGGYPRYGGGYGGRRYENTDEFRNDTNGEYYYGSGCRQTANGFVILGFMVYFLIHHSIPGHWMGL